MNLQLLDYVKQARQKGLADEQIKTNLVSAGWNAAEVADAVAWKEGDLVVPAPPTPPAPQVPVAAPAASTGPQSPSPVVEQLSTRGVEYTIMFIALGIFATSLGNILHNFVNDAFTSGPSYGGAASFSAAALLVSFPVFAILFLRLKKAELDKPETRQDPSRRKSVQLTLIISFLFAIGHLSTYLFMLMEGNSFSGDAGEGVASILNMLITITIAGGIFAYYWLDEHRHAS